MDSVHMPSLDSVEAGAPEAEIEITSEMIEAGVTVLWESGALEIFMEDFDLQWFRQTTREYSIHRIY
jgi:hypothetical protein